MAPLKPLPLGEVRAPFDDPAWVFELKLDGFRALARVHDGRAELISRRGLAYKAAYFASLAAQIPADLRAASAVLDGEIVAPGSDGRPRFYDLMRRKGAPVFAAFDVLEIDDEDLRDLSLIDRKKALRRAVRPKATAVQVVEFVRGTGIELYATACVLDLEGIVAKRGLALPGHDPASVVEDQKSRLLAEGGSGRPIQPEARKA